MTGLKMMCKSESFLEIPKPIAWVAGLSVSGLNGTFKPRKANSEPGDCHHNIHTSQYVNQGIHEICLILALLLGSSVSATRHFFASNTLILHECCAAARVSR